MDIWLRNQDSLYSEKMIGALNEKDSIEIVILGTSHATYGVNPNEFDLYAYNLANVSQRLYFDKRILLSIIDELTELKFVLISIDYHSLYSSSQGIRNFWSYYGNGIKYKDENYFLADLSPFLFGYTPRVSISLLKKEITKSIKYPNQNTLNFNVEEGVNILDSIKHGYLGYEGSQTDDFNEKKYFVKANTFNKYIYSSDEEKEIIEDLNNFIEILKSKNITPILFTAPTYEEYNDFLDEKVIDKNNKTIKDICEKYNILYFNHMNNSTFKKEDFYNANHLNKKGALKFSKILNNQIKTNF